MAKIDLSVIDVIVELERIGWSYEFIGDEELSVCCPMHEDSNPSASINVVKRVWRCNAAGCTGLKGHDFLTFLASALKTTRRVVYEDLASRYDLTEERTISPSTVERYHSALWDAKPLLKQLYARGITDDDIRMHRLGFDRGRITIPISNERGHWVNVKRYSPGAPGHKKMSSARGRGKARLYPQGQLGYDKIVVCGGELKALVAGKILNPVGIGAITSTGGEQFDASFCPLFKDKCVYVCFDIDEHGLTESQKVCAKLFNHVRWLGNLKLPLDIDKYPHGDINDWVAKEGADLKDFVALLDSAEPWKPKKVADLGKEEPLKLHLSNSVDAEYTGKRIKIKAIVSAIDTAPYVLPIKVVVSCDRGQDCCALCPIFARTPDKAGEVIAKIHPESACLLEMIAAPKKSQRKALMDGLGIPLTCKVVEFRTLKYVNVEDVRLSPQLEITSRAADHIMQPAFCLGCGMEPNEGYELVGRVYPHPKSQQAVFLVSERKTVQDALSGYKPSNEELKHLEMFQPNDWTEKSLSEKLDNIYEDLEANVTRIFERRIMHLVVDLAYHSPLLIPFDDRVVKGWVEVLILGDSSQGKSESTISLMKHYRMGEKAECKNATVAGLLGGLQQIGGRWFVTWGIIPTHDKRLVILEELKGASVEVISKLTDMRSSGVAEIPKIEKRRTHARTRLIALSNPRSDRPLSSYGFGIEAVKELIGSLEDVRRFDLTLLLSADEINADKLNVLMSQRPSVKHVYTSDRCRALILWAWTREPNEIQFDEKAEKLVLSRSGKLCENFTETIPLVDRGSMRFKLARLSAACACRTFSTNDKNLKTIRVRECHVEYVSNIVEKIYSSRVFGYRDFSTMVRASTSLVDPKKIASKLQQTPWPVDLVEQLLHTDKLELRDLCDWCGWDKADGLQLLSFLVRKHALRRDGRSYRKTPAFIDLLKRIEVKERPDHIVESSEF